MPQKYILSFRSAGHADHSTIHIMSPEEDREEALRFGDENREISIRARLSRGRLKLRVLMTYYGVRNLGPSIQSHATHSATPAHNEARQTVRGICSTPRSTSSSLSKDVVAYDRQDTAAPIRRAMAAASAPLAAWALPSSVLRSRRAFRKTDLRQTRPCQRTSVQVSSERSTDSASRHAKCPTRI